MDISGLRVQLPPPYHSNSKATTGTREESGTCCLRVPNPYILNIFLHILSFFSFFFPVTNILFTYRWPPYHISTQRQQPQGSRRVQVTFFSFFSIYFTIHYYLCSLCHYHYSTTLARKGSRHKRTPGRWQTGDSKRKSPVVFILPHHVQQPPPLQWWRKDSTEGFDIWGWRRFSMLFYFFFIYSTTKWFL